MIVQVDYCTHKAVRFACEKWHYSRCAPAGKQVRTGVWAGGVFKGVVVFSVGMRNQEKLFSLEQTEVCELARVALDEHAGVFHVTHVVSRALKLLRQRCPGLRLVVSFADPKQGHIGKIYQAGNWLYTGTSLPSRVLFSKRTGLFIHKRRYTGATFFRKPRKKILPGYEWLKPRKKIPPGYEWLKVPGKHRYVMPLDKKTRRLVKKMAKPYPEDNADARE